MTGGMKSGGTKFEKQVIKPRHDVRLARRSRRYADGSNKFEIRDMARAALFAALLCVVAPFSIVVGPIPLSFATLLIYLAAGVLDWRTSALSVVLYVFLGAVGLPVFTNFEGGFHKIAGVTGGYIIGYIPCVMAAGAVLKVFGRKLLPYILGMALGTVLLYTCGTVWFITQTGTPLAASLALCVTPFLPGDAAKIAVACAAAPKLRDALSRAARN